MNSTDLRHLLRERTCKRPLIVQPDRKAVAPAPVAETAKAASDGMNGWERQYAAELRMMQAAGEVKWFAFEWMRLRLANGAWFKPDFAVMMADGSLQFHEVKGTFFREAAKVRIKVAADRFPFVFIVATRKDGVWKREVIAT